MPLNFWEAHGGESEEETLIKEWQVALANSSHLVVLHSLPMHHVVGGVDTHSYKERKEEDPHTTLHETASSRNYSTNHEP